MKPQSPGSPTTPPGISSSRPRMAAGGPVTIRLLAQQLHVSAATVSRALKDDLRISEAVRQRIQVAAKELGYRPDPMLSALAAYRRNKVQHAITGEIAWINCWPEPKKLRGFKEFDLYWTSAADEAARSGYRLEEFCCPKDLSPERLQKILRARNIRGLLLTPAWSTAVPDWGDFRWEEFSIVRFGHSLKSPQAHVVTSDQLRDGMLAFESMWNRGYRRIGMVMWSAQGTRVVRFSAGYLYAQLRMGIARPLMPLAMHEQDAKRDQHQFESWLKKTKPDAILTDISTLPDMLKAAGCRVPEDVGLAAFSVLDGRANAGIDQNSKEIGRIAVQTLISLIHHNERGIPEVPREVLVAGHWVDGSTLPGKN